MLKSQSDNEWIHNSLLVLGALGTVVGITTSLFQFSETIVLAFVAGGGWFFVIALLKIHRRDNATIESLRVEHSAAMERKETELQDVRQQLGEWRTVATQDSESLNRFVSKAFAMPRVVARRSNHENETDVQQSEE